MRPSEVNPLVVIVVAAAVGVVVTRAGIALWDVLVTRPREARRTLQVIESSGRAVGQMYRTAMGGFPIDSTAHNEAEWTEHDDDHPRDPGCEIGPCPRGCGHPECGA